jgi:hypothetical protein
MASLTREPVAVLEETQGPSNGRLERCKPVARREGARRKTIVSEYSMWNIITALDAIAVNVGEGGTSHPPSPR